MVPTIGRRTREAAQIGGKPAGELAGVRSRYGGFAMQGAGTRYLSAWLGLWMLCASAALVAGCGQGQATAQRPDAEDRINKLYNLYRAYVDAHQRPPPNEQALREFGQKLTPEQRSARLIGDDLENIFISPRDGKKFVVRYNVRFDPSQSKAVIWEETGENGMHWVALSIGYTTQCDEGTLKEYTR